MVNKILWVDNLKFFGILAVVLGHISSPFGGFIFSFHMPLFFIIAGFFIKFDLSIKDFIVKDFKRLMIPYFIFAILGFVLEIVKRYVLHREKLNYIEEASGIFIWMDMESLINTYAFVLWFLPTLFFAKIILYIVKNYIKNLLVQLFIVSICFSISFYINLPFAIDNAMNALVYVFIGNMFFKYYDNQKIFYILPFILIGLLSLVGTPILDMASKNYSNIFINLIFAISVVYTLIIIFQKMNFNNNLIKIWGGNTMLLFIIHPYTNNIAHIVVEKLHFGDWYLKLFISLLLLQITLK